MCSERDSSCCHFYFGLINGDNDNDVDEEEGKEGSNDPANSDSSHYHNDNWNDDDNNSNSNDRNDNDKGRDITLRVYITHPADENLNVVGNSTFLAKFSPQSKSPGYSPWRGE